jgi:hypothetical protein
MLVTKVTLTKENLLTFIKVSSRDKRAVHEVFLYCSLIVLDLVGITSVSLLDLPLLESLGDVMLQIDPKYFFQSGSTDNSAMTKRCCELLCSPVIPLQLTAYHTLTR